MECNREEAIRAKEVGERKLREKDFAGARKFILKAKALFPELDGIFQMLTTLEVYIASENKINGEIDWYGVLGLNSSADEETIKKQYRKLVLVLHPDKNKSTGAEGAFKLLSEAWSLLSDKSRRLAYNQRRSSKGSSNPNIQHNILTKNGAAPPPPNANGFHNISKREKIAKNNARVQLSSSPRPQPISNTFWTICHKCKMHYEYLRIYHNHTLLCPNCHKPFHASETPPPANFSRPHFSSAQQRNQTTSHCASNSSNYAKNNEKMMRDHEVAPCVEEGLFKKRNLNDYGYDYGGIGSYNNRNVINNFMQLDIGSLKAEKARTEIRKKIREWHLEAVTKATEAIKNKENQKGKRTRKAL